MFLMLDEFLEERYTAVGGSRAGGSRANFWILRKIMSEALGPVWIF